MGNLSNNSGRAYEYACLCTLQETISKMRPSIIVKNSSFDAALRVWNLLDEKTKTLYLISAKSIIETIFAMEPNIVEVDDDMLNLYIQPDKKGEFGDVRDIIIERKNIVWQIGLSIKHNHFAAKHSRLAKHIDIGEKWYGSKCSEEYWNDIKPIFSFLEEEKKKGSFFRDLNSKEDDVYVPLLKAFIKEIKKQITNDPSISRKIVEYVLGKYDFYKIVSIDKKQITSIQSFNMYGTLNMPSRKEEPKIVIPCLDLPKNILFLDFKPNSKTTVLMCFDNGWQFSFRIHNAKDLVETSLKFDIQIVGIPVDVNITYKCKW